MKKLMSSRRHRRPEGDTLIEVLFAFTILSAIISVAFGGAMSSYKSAQTAQNRTQALFLAQYQADALKTYRDSLGWDTTENSLASFLDAGSVSLVGMRTYATTPFSPFCMELATQAAPAPSYWKVQTSADTANPAANCNVNARSLATNLNSPTMQITLSAITNDSIKATVIVSYKSANQSAITEQVTNTILLTKTR